jgi:hypothetical protein
MYTQYLIIHFDYGSRNFNPLYDYKKILINHIENKNLGEWGGYQIVIDGSEANFRLNTNDVEKLFEEIKNLLKSLKLLKNVNIIFCFDEEKNSFKKFKLDKVV